MMDRKTAGINSLAAELLLVLQHSVKSIPCMIHIWFVSVLLDADMAE